MVVLLENVNQLPGETQFYIGTFVDSFGEESFSEESFSVDSFSVDSFSVDSFSVD